jgi:CRP-like cAMP-binding protein
MDDILKLGRRAVYASGEILLRPSDEGHVVFSIVSGMVHVYTIEQSGIKNIHIIYGTGDIFPSSWAVQSRPLNLFYEAITDCEVAKIRQEDLEQLLQGNAAASFAMLKQMARQFMWFKANIDNLEYKYARERLAYRLLLIGRKFGTVKGDGLLLYRLSQDELASSTNVSRESVNRELRRFERLGYVTYEHGKQMYIRPTELRKELAPDDTPLFIDDL